MPCPTWVNLEEFTIPEQFLTRSASIIQSQLGPHGIELVGGKEWWQWRRPEIPMKAEWIEMKSDHTERLANGAGMSERIILYVHGGAYYFGSTGEHRYQMQRHARKLKAQLLAPKYRLAPQFPFPCGLHDCIATYLYLIEKHDPSTILLGGDSAGGGMVIAMLCTLRDQGIPLPAGALLLSPWVDLTHSFPSVAGDGEFDYIPPMGFHHRPSMAWPPPTAADIESLKTGGGGAAALSNVPQPRDRIDQKPDDRAEVEAAKGYSVKPLDAQSTQAASSIAATPAHAAHGNDIPKPGQNLSIELDGKLIEIKDQIQMYAANHLLAHPLVSPVMQPSLGGLPPLLFQVGGGELLRDEQIYLAHRAANPTEYPPSDSVLDEHDPDRSTVHKYGATKVQLQVWDDLCHVPHTLSFTRPAKYMYRSVAQFGAWALAHAQKRPVTILDDDQVSVISSTSSDDKSILEKEKAADAQDNLDGETAPRSVSNVPMRAHTITTSSGGVGKAGDPLPPFVNHMIRQRVDRHGLIYPLAPASELPSLHVDRNTIGKIKPGPVRKWIAKKSDWDVRFAKEKRNVQKARLKEMQEGYDSFAGETPPPTALAGRRQKGMEKQKHRKGKSWGLAMWSGWGSKHDESTIERKKKFGRRPTQSVVMPEAGEGIAASSNPNLAIENAESKGSFDPSATAEPAHNDRDIATQAGMATVAGVGAANALHETHKVEGSENTYLSANNSRPHNGTVAYPFKLRNTPDASVSTATLDSSRDHVRPMGHWRDGSSDNRSSMLGMDDGGMKSGTPGEWVDGASSDRQNEVGGHDWLVSSAGKEANEHEEQHKSPEQVTSNHDSHGNVSGVAIPSTTDNNDVREPQQSQPTHESDTTADKSGNEIGGHNWLVGSRKTSGSAPVTSQTTDSRRPVTGDGAHDNSARDNNTQNNEVDTSKQKRPILETFTTARESL